MTIHFRADSRLSVPLQPRSCCFLWLKSTFLFCIKQVNHYIELLFFLNAPYFLFIIPQCCKMSPMNHQGACHTAHPTEHNKSICEKINKTAGCKWRVKASPLAYSVILILPQQQNHVSVDLWAPSHTLFYNTINKSGVMNLLVTSSSFSSLRLLHPTSPQYWFCDCTLIRQWSLWQHQYIWKPSETPVTERQCKR